MGRLVAELTHLGRLCPQFAELLHNVSFLGKNDSSP